MHSRSRMTVDPRILTVPGRSTPGYLPTTGRHVFLHQVRKRREVFGESHERVIGPPVHLLRSACEAATVVLW